jgi:hypothetical protein
VCGAIEFLEAVNERMKPMCKLMYLGILILPLAACQSPDINVPEQRAKDDAFCQSLGLLPGTAPYDRCRIQRAGVAREESDQRRRFLYGY